MSNDCKGQVLGLAMRVARLEASGVPLPGANNLYETTQFVRAKYTQNIEAGGEALQKNARGEICVYNRVPDAIKDIAFELEICAPDPELYELLSGGDVLTSGNAVGWAMPALGADPVPNGVSIEIWAKRVDAAGNTDAALPYAWWVFPRVYLYVTEREFAAAAFGNPFSGFGKENPNWFNGPRNDWPVASDRAVQWLPAAESTLPANVCGYQSTATT